jgi:hypothetical protein
MKILRRALIAGGVAAALIAIPTQTAGAFWGGPAPGLGPWRHGYVHDPNYRFGPPATRTYIRDLYLYGPVYAAWHQHRRSRWW